MFKIAIFRLSILFFLFSICSLFIGSAHIPEIESDKVNSESVKPEIRQLYEDLSLSKDVNYTAFAQAYSGYKKLMVENQILTLIDFSKPSSQKRLFVIDLEKKEILFKTHVAHGRKSGDKYATSFSNKSGSNQSSLGFFLTEETYNGKKTGYSLRLKGLDKGINDNVRARGVVIHGADYANPDQIQSSGRLGRSFGCPALPEDINDAVINVIKGGSLIYAYSDKFNDFYLKRSSILSSKKS